LEVQYKFKIFKSWHIATCNNFNTTDEENTPTLSEEWGPASLELIQKLKLALVTLNQILEDPEHLEFTHKS